MICLPMLSPLGMMADVTMQALHYYRVDYILDGRNRWEEILAEDKDEARELFSRQHPSLKIVSVMIVDETSL